MNIRAISPEERWRIVSKSPWKHSLTSGKKNALMGDFFITTDGKCRHRDKREGKRWGEPEGGWGNKIQLLTRFVLKSPLRCKLLTGSTKKIKSTMEKNLVITHAHGAKKRSRATTGADNIGVYRRREEVQKVPYKSKGNR